MSNWGAGSGLPDPITWKFITGSISKRPLKSFKGPVTCTSWPGEGAKPGTELLPGNTAMPAVPSCR